MTVHHVLDDEGRDKAALQALDLLGYAEEEIKRLAESGTIKLGV